MTGHRYTCDIKKLLLGSHGFFFVFFFLRDVAKHQSTWYFGFERAIQVLSVLSSLIPSTRRDRLFGCVVPYWELSGVCLPVSSICWVAHSEQGQVARDSRLLTERKANQSDPSSKTSSLLCVSWVLTPKQATSAVERTDLPGVSRPRSETEAGRVKTGDPRGGARRSTAAWWRQHNCQSWRWSRLSRSGHRGQRSAARPPVAHPGWGPTWFWEAPQSSAWRGSGPRPPRGCSKSQAVRVATTDVVEPGRECLIRGTVHGNQAVPGDLMLSPRWRLWWKAHSTDC